MEFSSARMWEHLVSVCILTKENPTLINIKGSDHLSLFSVLDTFADGKRDIAFTLLHQAIKTTWFVYGYHDIQIAVNREEAHTELRESGKFALSLYIDFCGKGESTAPSCVISLSIVVNERARKFFFHVLSYFECAIVLTCALRG